MTPTSAPIIIIGAGGHGTVVADALLAAGCRVLGFTDPNCQLHGSTLLGLPVLGNDAVLLQHRPEDVQLALGIGTAGGTQDATRRREVQQRLQGQGWRFVSVRHPSAVVSAFAKLHAGVQLLAASVVQAGAQVGEGCIVNTAAVVEHDTVLGAYSHLAPRALLCGNVQVGDCSHIGAAAVVRQGISLGAGTVVGAGAVVVSSSEGAALLVGVPARRRGEHT